PGSRADRRSGGTGSALRSTCRHSKRWRFGDSVLVFGVRSSPAHRTPHTSHLTPHTSHTSALRVRVSNDKDSALLRIADKHVPILIGRDAVGAGGRRKGAQRGKLAFRRDAEDGHRRALSPRNIEVGPLRIVVDDIHAVTHRQAGETLAGLRLEHDGPSLAAARQEKAACLVWGNPARSLAAVPPA